MAAVLAILLILVGLPLLAWWVGGRRHWSRADDRARDQLQIERDWRDRHGLSREELARVGEALNRGRALTDPRLRAAVVERARMKRDAQVAWQRQRPTLAAVMPWLGALWLLAALCVIVYAVSSGESPYALFFNLVMAVGLGGVAWVERRTLQRAIDLNEGPTS